MVGSREVGREDKGEIACWTFGWEGADFCGAARTEVAVSRGFGVAGAEGGVSRDSTRRETHHEEGGGRGCSAGGGLLGYWWGGHVHHQFAEMLFVEDDGVAALVTVVGARD